MKKIAAILLISSLLYWVSKSPFSTSSTDHKPTTIINEADFVNLVRDLELLNSWAENNDASKENRNMIRDQNYQKILALHGVDLQVFKENVKYYLENCSERALPIYKKLDEALEELSM